MARSRACLVVLGTGLPEYHEQFQKAAAKYPDFLGVRIGFDNSLAHLIEAGSDMFLMPSRYEPCGLNQMYSLRYGTVPVVRATGGLADTVIPFDLATRRGTGFVFERYDSEAFLAQLARALLLFEDKESWTILMRNGMAQDFSWGRAARLYVDLYKKAMEKRK